MKITVFVGAIIYRAVDEDCQVLVQECSSINPKYKRQGIQEKFPGGGKKSRDRDFQDTLRRELEEEIRLRIKPGVEPKIVYDVLQTQVRMILYAIDWNSLVGQMRTEPLLDGDTLLGELRWYSLSEAEKKVYHTHLPGLRRFIRDHTSLERVS